MNAPSVFNAVFNYANFVNGRANHYFNGENPFGPADPEAGIWVKTGAGLESSLYTWPFRAWSLRPPARR